MQKDFLVWQRFQDSVSPVHANRFCTNNKTYCQTHLRRLHGTAQPDAGVGIQRFPAVFIVGAVILTGMQVNHGPLVRQHGDIDIGVCQAVGIFPFIPSGHRRPNLPFVMIPFRYGPVLCFVYRAFRFIGFLTDNRRGRRMLYHVEQSNCKAKNSQ